MTEIVLANYSTDRKLNAEKYTKELRPTSLMSVFTIFVMPSSYMSTHIVLFPHPRFRTAASCAIYPPITGFRSVHPLNQSKSPSSLQKKDGGN
jgi:hypothetical protein